MPRSRAEDILIQITVHNRGPEAATLHVLPTVWFRNTWSVGGDVQRPELHWEDGEQAVVIAHPDLGRRFFTGDGAADWLFTENETNDERLFKTANRTPYVKDGINNCIVHGNRDAVNPERKGTKASAHYPLTVEAGASRVIRLRLCDTAPIASRKKAQELPFGTFDAVMKNRKPEADEFYGSVIPASLNADEKNVMRQALAGMLWSKQFYFYDVDQWLEERGAEPFKAAANAPRNDHWHHMYNADVISMPDKWEYPWYAAWDLAFHVLALTLVDEDFGKEQLDPDAARDTTCIPTASFRPTNGTSATSIHPCTPGPRSSPIAWSERRTGKGDLEWLEHAFQKLLLNFTWWVNRKDRDGSNLFEGGFLGLDNIGVFDRSAPLPTGGYLEQADGTAWMALFAQNMLQIAAQLAQERPGILSMAHEVRRTLPVDRVVDGPRRRGRRDVGRRGWLLLRRAAAAGRRPQPLKLRSMVGLLPIFPAIGVRPCHTSNCSGNAHRTF